MRVGLAIIAFSAWVGAFASLSGASPLQLPPPGDRPQDGMSPREPERPSLPRGRLPAAAGAIRAPALLQRFNDAIGRLQRPLNQMLSREMRQIRDTGSLAAVLTVSLIAFVYGVLHAAGPGHGKLVVSAFFLGREARIVRGVMMGGLVSMLQTFSAIAIVLVLAFALGRAGFDIVQQSVWVEVASYGLIVLVGLSMIYAALTGRHLGHHHAEAIDDHRVRGGVILAAGLTPCASAIIILLFALAHGASPLGLPRPWSWLWG